MVAQKNKVLLPSTILKAKKIKLLIALVLNCLIVGFSAGGLAWAWIRFSNQGRWFWSWYTYLSVLFIGVVSAIFVVFASIAIHKKEVELPRFVYILKNIGTAVITITLFVTFFSFMLHTSGGKWEPKWSVYEKSNFILHIVIPLLAIGSNLICERTLKMKFIDTLYGMITAGVYSAHYLAVGYTHLKDGKIIPGPEGDADRYDRYGIFNIVGAKWAWVMIFALAGVTFLLCWLCWLGNRKIHICDVKAPAIFNFKKHQKKND